MVYADENEDMAISNDEIIQQQDYYPYGARYINQQKRSIKSKYQFNGIEHVNDFGLDLSMALYRSNDGFLGMWGQVDPKAEALYRLSPYQSMANNPIKYSDPEGDLPFLAVVGIGVATGIFSNGLANASNGQGFFDSAGKAAFWGGVSAAASFGIGSAFGGVGSFGRELGRGLAHGVSTGIQSELSGGSFGQGFLSGGVSSGIGSSLDGLGPMAQIGGGGLGGGIGSSLVGANFFSGFGQGIAVGAFNHALQEIYRANLLKSESPINDILRAFKEANASGQAQNLYDFIEENYYQNKTSPLGDTYDKIIKYGDHSFRVIVEGNMLGKDYFLRGRSHYDVGGAGFGYLDRFSDFKKTTSYLGGFHSGFYITGTYNNYLVRIGGRSGAAVNFLKKLYKSL